MIAKKISKLTLLISFAGFGVSLYALLLHIENLLSPGGGAFCDVSATINCSAVIGSRYGEFASIPLGAYGMAYFAVMFAAVITPKFASITKKRLATLELLIALSGVIVAGLLMMISYGVLKLICPTCSVIHALVALYAIIKIYGFFKARREAKTLETQPEEFADAYTRFAAISICLAIPPLFAGLITPFIVSYFGKHESKSVPVKTEQVQKNNAPTPLAKRLREFNKTNYVGDGEDYRRGSDQASVVVQIFSDFGCPHCKTANDSLVKAQDIVGESNVLLVYRFYPLSSECNDSVGGKGFYEYNCSLVVAARCAGQQGKFWEFKEWAFDGQNWPTYERDDKFSPDGLVLAAKNLGIDETPFSECLQGHSEDAKIKNDVAFANQLKIKGTPMILINGKEYQGSLDVNTFVKKFESEL